MRISLLAILISIGTMVQAQAPIQWIEVGVFGGISNYYGDLTRDYVVIGESHPAFGGFVKWNMNMNAGIKLNLYHGEVSGADANSNRSDQKLRNLSFTSPVTEVGLTFEYNFPGLYPKELRRPFSPYIYAGVGGFHFNPSAFYKGEWYELQPLGTEGQGINSFDFREKYDLYAFAIPFGAGVKWAFSERWNLGLEYGARFTFTDYLDDVSRTYVSRNVMIEENGITAYNLSNRSGEYLNTEPMNFDENDFRGDPTRTDWYMFFGLTLSRNFIAGTEDGFLTLDKPGLGCFQPKQTRKNQKRFHTTK